MAPGTQSTAGDDPLAAVQAEMPADWLHIQIPEGSPDDALYTLIGSEGLERVALILVTPGDQTAPLRASVTGVYPQASVTVALSSANQALGPQIAAEMRKQRAEAPRSAAPRMLREARQIEQTGDLDNAATWAGLAAAVASGAGVEEVAKDAAAMRDRLTVGRLVAAREALARLNASAPYEGQEQSIKRALGIADATIESVKANPELLAQATRLREEVVNRRLDILLHDLRAQVAPESDGNLNFNLLPLLAEGCPDSRRQEVEQVRNEFFDGALRWARSCLGEQPNLAYVGAVLRLLAQYYADRSAQIEALRQEARGRIAAQLQAARSIPPENHVEGLQIVQAVLAIDPENREASELRDRFREAGRYEVEVVGFGRGVTFVSQIRYEAPSLHFRIVVKHPNEMTEAEYAAVDPSIRTLWAGQALAAKLWYEVKFYDQAGELLSTLRTAGYPTDFGRDRQETGGRTRRLNEQADEVVAFADRRQAPDGATVARITIKVMVRPVLR